MVCGLRNLHTRYIDPYETPTHPISSYTVVRCSQFLASLLSQERDVKKSDPNIISQYHVNHQPSSYPVYAVP